MREYSSEARVPDIILERYRLDELPQDEVDRLERLIDNDESLKRRLEAIDASNTAIERNYPPSWLADRIRTARSRRRAALRVPAAWAIPISAAAVIFVVIVVASRSGEQAASHSATASSEDRIKGLEPGLAVYRRTRDGSETLADGDVARPGDVVRLGYRAAGRSFGMIVSIDGRGGVTRHLPATGERSAALRSGETILLDTAYELDDAPSWERFYFVTAARPFDVEPIVSIARRSAAGGRDVPPSQLDLPSGFEQSTFSLQKEARP